MKPQDHLPAIPREWQLALAQAVVGLAVAFGAPLDTRQQTALIAFAALVFALMVTAGTFLRHSRAKHLGHLLAPDAEAIIDELFAAGQRERLTPAGEPAPVRQIRVAEEAARAAGEADVENGPPPAPGTYPADDPEPTGS